MAGEPLLFLLHGAEEIEKRFGPLNMNLIEKHVSGGTGNIHSTWQVGVVPVGQTRDASGCPKNAWSGPV